ncbi:uncharacterized protein [Lepeophtheirus salmonis]|uniref:uncharacterized protein n=1 Tax=Lepeophtheirus salmonis TaxID=72036 RepID=UPI001AE69B79|nr:INO80 complex subunit E-like [Lepeophtheirus salmonis]
MKSQGSNKEAYRSLKRKFRELITANEILQEELKRRQKKLLRVNQDKYFLMERLLHHEKPLQYKPDSNEEKRVKKSKKSLLLSPPLLPPPLPPQPESVPVSLPAPAPPPPTMSSFEDSASSTFDFDSFPTAMPNELFDSDIKIEEEVVFS